MAEPKITLTISLSKWNSLSPPEKDLAKKLGISISVDKVRPDRPERVVKVVPLSEYYLGFHVTCELCEGKEDQVFLMRLDKKGQIPILISAEPFDSVDKVRWEERKTPACRNCGHNLLTTTKRNLIEQLKSCSVRIAVLTGRKFRVKSERPASS